MAEGGIAEKFPDEWDLQFLGNSIINQLSPGISPDFLIERYIFIIYIYFFFLFFIYFILSFDKSLILLWGFKFTTEVSYLTIKLFY